MEPCECLPALQGQHGRGPPRPRTRGTAVWASRAAVSLEPNLPSLAHPSAALFPGGGRRRDQVSGRADKGRLSVLGARVGRGGAFRGPRLRDLVSRNRESPQGWASSPRSFLRNLGEEGSGLSVYRAGMWAERGQAPSAGNSHPALLPGQPAPPALRPGSASCLPISASMSPGSPLCKEPRGSRVEEQAGRLGSRHSRDPRGAGLWGRVILQGGADDR